MEASACQQNTSPQSKTDRETAHHNLLIVEKLVPFLYKKTVLSEPGVLMRGQGGTMLSFMAKLVKYIVTHKIDIC